MSAIEVLVVVVFGCIGYFAVSAIVSFAMKRVGAKSNSDTNSSFSRKSQNQNTHDHQRKPFFHEGNDISTSWFLILNVPQTASLEIITSAYKSKQINAAYDYASKLCK